MIREYNESTLKMYERRAEHFRTRANDLLEDMKKQVLRETGQEFTTAISSQRDRFLMHGTRYIYSTYAYLDEFIDVLYQYDLSVHRLKEQKQYKADTERKQNNSQSLGDQFLGEARITQSTYV